MDNVGPIGVHVSISGGLPNAIVNAVRVGARCIQIFSSSPGQWSVPKHDQELINKFIEQRKLYEIDAVGVIVHLGSHQGKGYGTVKGMLVDKVEEMLEKTLRQTRLIVENSAGQKGKLSSTIEEIADEFEAVSSNRLALCLDTCHLFAAGYDIRDKKVVDSLARELRATRLLPRLVAIHVNDAKDPLGSHRDRHENLGEGQIGIKGLKTFFAHPAFRHLPKIIETPGFEQKGPNRRNIQILNELASKTN